MHRVSLALVLMITALFVLANRPVTVPHAVRFGFVVRGPLLIQSFSSATIPVALSPSSYILTIYLSLVFGCLVTLAGIRGSSRERGLGHRSLFVVSVSGYRFVKFLFGT
jgi:hypothetical protein